VKIAKIKKRLNVMLLVSTVQLLAMQWMLSAAGLDESARILMHTF